MREQLKGNQGNTPLRNKHIEGKNKELFSNSLIPVFKRSKANNEFLYDYVAIKMPHLRLGRTT